MRPVRIFVAAFAVTVFSSLLQPALSQDPIKIGVMFPYTGPISAQARPGRDAITQAFDEENNAIAGRKIELLFEDSIGRPDTGLTKIKGFGRARQGPPAAVGAGEARWARQSRHTSTNRRSPGVSTVALASLTRAEGATFSVSFRRRTNSEPSPPEAAREWDGRRPISSDGMLRRAARRMGRQEESLAPRIIEAMFPNVATSDYAPYLTKMDAAKADGVFAAMWGMMHRASSGNTWWTEQEDAIVRHRLVYQRGAPRRHAAGRRRYPQRVYLLLGTLDTPENKKFISDYQSRYRRNVGGLGTTRRRPSARFLPVSTCLPSCGSGARRGNRLNLFPVYQLNRIPHRRRSRRPCLSIRQLEHPDLGTLRFLCSFARPTPTIRDLQPTSHQ